MIAIYLCEDEPEQLHKLQNLIRSALVFMDQEVHLRCAVHDPYLLLKELECTKETGLYFLDIDLHSDIDGFELAQRIRKQDPRGYIVFVTTHSEAAALTFTYKIEAMDFILKDQPELLPDKIHRCIATALQRETMLKKQTNQMITLKIGDIMLCLDPDDIIFLQSDSGSHKLTLHTTNGVKQFTGSLKEMQALLDSRFFRCHSSTLINIHHVCSFHPAKRMLVMDNRETCMVSTRQQQTLRLLLSK